MPSHAHAACHPSSTAGRHRYQQEPAEEQPNWAKGRRRHRGKWYRAMFCHRSAVRRPRRKALLETGSCQKASDSHLPRHGLYGKNQPTAAITPDWLQYLTTSEMMSAIQGQSEGQQKRIGVLSDCHTVVEGIYVGISQT